MHGIVSLLDEPNYSKVEKLWLDLELECGLKGIKVTPIPHFSWQVAMDYDLDLLRPVLQEIAASAMPFKAHTTGVGIFSGPKPVVFINVVKTDAMMRFHKLVWEKTSHTARGISPLYGPQSWIPHITIAHTDMVWPSVSCAIQKLVYQPFNWEIKVSSISVISQAEGLVGEESIHFDFTGSAQSPLE
jgi:hypothetical protein